MELAQLGWSPAWATAFTPYESDNLIPARVATESRERYGLLTVDGIFAAELAGRLRYTAVTRDAFPCVGDWVAARPTPDGATLTIHAVLPRQSAFNRQAAGGRTDAQTVAANVDHVLLVAGLDGDFNLRRIERYVTLAWNSGALPQIVLNKRDLCNDVDARVAEVEAVAPGVSVYAVSAATGGGMEALHALLTPGRTIALLGSSGVGKSSLVNALLGEDRQAVNNVRADDSRGRHTTTRRELVVLPAGGVLIDTPGMRELQLWADGDGLADAFAEIAVLAAQCRFGDCTHAHEPGCAVRAALDAGTLAPERLESYHKLQRELAHQARKQSHAAQEAEVKRWKAITRSLRHHPKYREGR